MHSASDRLRQVKSFPQLVKYLRDELDWPIEQDSFDDLTFDWDPGELGIDVKTAAKIDEIKQLRPLTSGQPWGIFFVKFEPKRLPIVVLRRVLNQLALKKRPSGTRSGRQGWKAQDLLFISAHGEGGDRQLTFAHFSEPANARDLSTLRVLGWDGDDTTLTVEHTARTLTEKLAWPEHTTELDAWRARWASAFELRPHEVIRTSKGLAVRLADLAKGIRTKAERVLELESESGRLRKLHAAFRGALIHDLSETDFADMYAQTIAYGLFSAAVTGEGAGERGVLIADDVTKGAPITNPFLRELLGSFLHVGGRRDVIDFDELGVQEVVELLRRPGTHLDSILRDFGNRTRDEDPVIHFYESFLREYDKKRKIERGVFYTPQPVVSYIVRGVHELLQAEFGIEDGLASIVTWDEMATRYPKMPIPSGTAPTSAFVQILDPATGTATFLVEVIDVIYRTMKERWGREGVGERGQIERWNAYVPNHLLPRICGYELMMAPYAIAHMKVGLKLLETGYHFSSDARARIYLTNALEPAQDFSDRLAFDAPALAHEAQAVNAVKRDLRFTVILGNPPYSGHSVNNQIPTIVDLVYDYKRGLPELERPGQAKWLQDDYVKFIRYAEEQLERVPVGALGYVTNHSFLDNPTFKGMRRHVLETFPALSLTDLHGNSKKKERAPDGSSDENVFEIQQGVAVIIGRRGQREEASVRFYDLYGIRHTKYQWLSSHSSWKTNEHVAIAPSKPAFLFRPQDTSLVEEYGAGVALQELMALNGDPAPGIVTTHDEFAISWTRNEAIHKVEQFLQTKNEAEARALFTLCSQSQWNYTKAKRALASGEWRSQVVRVLYRPFDWRWTVFNQHVAVHRRERVMRHMLDRQNLGIICTRQTKDHWGVFITRDICAHKTCGAYDINFLFPLYLHSEEAQLGLHAERTPNFSSPALKRLLGAFNDREASAPQHSGDVTPEDVLHYMYAVFHSVTYRDRYAQFLKSDFPKVPCASKPTLFRELAHLGAELASTHLLESTSLDPHGLEYGGPRNPEVEKVAYNRRTVWLDKAETCGFQNVPETVWSFHVGGYQVCEKWLKDRKGRRLTTGEVSHYQRIVAGILETTRLMAEVDRAIQAHGGWPGAFQALPDTYAARGLLRRVAESGEEYNARRNGS